jgi:deazaflavin-dependent oxidoreductase (nitroreductase family)
MSLMSLPQSVTDTGFKVLNKVHRTTLRLSGGRIGRSGYGMPVVELSTVGRKTGQTRVTVLTSPVHSEDRVLLVASKYGDDRNPQWYGNLTANPDVEILIDGRRRQLRARTATGAERTELWSEILAAYKGYGAYQEKTAREIPVVVCEPRPA